MSDRIEITKATLKELNAARGHLDKDTGDVFIGFVGALDPTANRYVGRLEFRGAKTDPPALSPAVSIAGIVAGDVCDLTPGDVYESE